MARWFSLDHKVIGLQYAVTSMVFLLVGFGLMMLLRWQLAYPMQPIPHFATMPTVYHGAYEHSVPGAARDFTPQDRP